MEHMNFAVNIDFDSKHNIADESTPCNGYMSGHYKRSHAYYTLHSRLPAVLKNLSETLRKNRRDIEAEYGRSSREELHMISNMISQLAFELQTNRPFRQFCGDERDLLQWNSFLDQLPEDQCTPYTTCWLYAECYVYRKLHSLVENSIYLKEFDYFAKEKQYALIRCISEMRQLAEYTRRSDRSKRVFEELVKISLWSNCSERIENSAPQKANQALALDHVASMDGYILLNMVDSVWQCLSVNPINKSNQVDIVCGSGGYELFADLILAEYIIEKGLAKKVRFHVKAHQWFINDVTQSDFHAALKYLSGHRDYMVSLVAKKFLQFLTEDKFELAPISYFWTGPYPYCMMRDLAPDLYASLSQSKLIIFKGDLNYRKLMGDVCWDTTLEIHLCVRGFLPSHYCTVRTLSAEVVCGLPRGLSDRLAVQDPKWMVSGRYGIIQFVDCTREFGY